MREPWQVYLMMFVVVGLMLLGKKLMITGDSDDDKNEPKDKHDKS